MGSDWSWTLALPGGALTSATVERLLALANDSGLSPHRPDGGINGFANLPGREGDHEVLTRHQLVQGLTTGSWATNLWTRSEADIGLSTTPSGGTGWDLVSLSLNSAHCRRTPTADAEPFRQLHRQLTGLWLTVATGLGAVFGRVEDEWSLEQIWSELPDSRMHVTPPPPGSSPDWLSWLTYFDADHHRRLAPVLAELNADVRRTSDGAAVIVLLGDPAAVDPVKFAQLHHEYRRAVAAHRGQVLTSESG
ncbi:hypothetical protein BBK82_42535 [Lentzea guizhouensis]|uniref:Uncharacterized protein n=1 Tax=Lentzea guizhouensis TaxID=1586287 RepID=A0A1B2HVD3_9PSEU|nr:hypothetical protein [Lentzea guizhouensis]ANZ41642.1 hypothetical protein BBK82_42535 [Lentzea guizhouensis]